MTDEITKEMKEMVALEEALRKLGEELDRESEEEELKNRGVKKNE